MGNLAYFLKKNKKEKKNAFFAATKSLCDENGEPLKWEIKALSTKETEAIREKCTIDVPVTGKPGVMRPKVNSSKYVAELLVSAVVFPDLYNAELQDSYGVKTASDLLKEMVDDPAEYNNFVEFVQEYNGLDETMNDKVEEAKN